MKCEVLAALSLQVGARFPYTHIVSFGGCGEDFMLVVADPAIDQPSTKLVFSTSRIKVRIIPRLFIYIL